MRGVALEENPQPRGSGVGVGRCRCYTSRTVGSLFLWSQLRPGIISASEKPSLLFFFLQRNPSKQRVKRSLNEISEISSCVHWCIQAIQGIELWVFMLMSGESWWMFNNLHIRQRRCGRLDELSHKPNPPPPQVGGRWGFQVLSGALTQFFLCRSSLSASGSLAWTWPTYLAGAWAERGVKWSSGTCCASHRKRRDGGDWNPLEKGDCAICSASGTNITGDKDDRKRYYSSKFNYKI